MYRTTRYARRECRASRNGVEARPGTSVHEGRQFGGLLDVVLDRVTEELVFRLAHREHDDPRLGSTRLGDLDAAPARHVQVANDEVGFRGADGGDRFVGGARLADHLEAGSEIGPYPVPPNRMVVAQHD